MSVDCESLQNPGIFAVESVMSFQVKPAAPPNVAPQSATRPKHMSGEEAFVLLTHIFKYPVSSLETLNSH